MRKTIFAFVISLFAFSLCFAQAQPVVSATKDATVNTQQETKQKSKSCVKKNKKNKKCKAAQTQEKEDTSSAKATQQAKDIKN